MVEEGNTEQADKCKFKLLTTAVAPAPMSVVGTRGRPALSGRVFSPVNAASAPTTAAAIWQWDLPD